MNFDWLDELSEREQLDCFPLLPDGYAPDPVDEGLLEYHEGRLSEAFDELAQMRQAHKDELDRWHAIGTLHAYEQMHLLTEWFCKEIDKLRDKLLARKRERDSVVFEFRKTLFKRQEMAKKAFRDMPENKKKWDDLYVKLLRVRGNGEFKRRLGAVLANQ